MLHCFRYDAVRSLLNNAKPSTILIPKRTAIFAPSAIPSPRANETFTLDNGDTLGFSICGPSEAPALFYFHGQSGSRLQGLDFAESAKNIGLRIICPDRPGIGLSTFDSSRKLLDYPTHIAQLARYLGLENYRVMGGSGGGPYVLGRSRFAQNIIHSWCAVGPLGI